jgi:hypothetical protein
MEHGCIVAGMNQQNLIQWTYCQSGKMEICIPFKQMSDEQLFIRSDPGANRGLLLSDYDKITQMQLIMMKMVDINENRFGCI